MIIFFIKNWFKHLIKHVQKMFNQVMIYNQPGEDLQPGEEISCKEVISGYIIWKICCKNSKIHKLIEQTHHC